MGGIIETLRQKAREKPKIIVFPESEDSRIQEAVKFIEKEGIAYPYLLTSYNMRDDKKDEFARFYYERRKHKGESYEEARRMMDEPLYYAAMMTKCGDADGFVAGACLTTSAVIKAAIRCLDVNEEVHFISSCFIMIFPDSRYGEDGVFVFSDCAVNPSPNSEQLSAIGILSARFARDVLGLSPRVAFLSFSTKGSAKNKYIEKVREAVVIAKSKNEGFLIDGELQADSAIVPQVAQRKVKESEVAGRANVLIFPNLDAGNICYKLTQRLANARAIGPIILGTQQFCSDLSRGCSSEDVIDSTAVTVIRAQRK